MTNNDEVGHVTFECEGVFGKNWYQLVCVTP